MLYQIMNGTVSCGGQVILSHIDFRIKGNEKIALTGRNGAGKTTLLRLLAGELELDRDDKRQGEGILASRKFTVGILHQTADFPEEQTVEELLLSGCGETDPYSMERFRYEAEYDRLLTGFGFSKAEKQRSVSEFSGGEQTKLALIRLLLQKPELLLLDEPTNHLDMKTVEWLEQYMQSYPGAVIFVSHDRFFLDRVADTVYELEKGKLKRYPGNYTSFRIQKQKELELQRKAYLRQQEEIEKLNELIRRFRNKPAKAAFARSRKTILERTERIEKPEEDNVHMFAGALEPEIIGSKWVLDCEHLKIGYDRVLLELSLRIRRGQKIGIIGENGVGKSTFLKTAAGMLPPLEGKLELGNRTVMGYFDQQTAATESEKRVLEHFRDCFGSMTEKEARSTLAAYLFYGRDAAKKISELSGGEKSRLMLCELMTARPNFLILDEPTNHMDLPAKETLESAFRAYTGTILFVSHDRYFVDRVADAILVFREDGVMYYPFGYRHYLEHVRRRPEGETISAQIAAENQALIADLKAVPEKEKHMLREIGTESAYREWLLAPAETALETAQADWRVLLERAEEECFLDHNEPFWEELREKEKMWTEACLKWYDIYLKLESEEY